MAEEAEQRGVDLIGVGPGMACGPPPDTQVAPISSVSGAPPPPVTPAQLPADLPTFAGREPELSQVAKMLSPGSESPLVAICAIDGMAGIGKTTFAIHWAHHVAKLSHGAAVAEPARVRLEASATTPADALGALLLAGAACGHIPDDLDARAWHVPKRPGRKARAAGAGQRARCGAGPAAPAGSPGCLVIATSRTPLAGAAMTEGARLVTLKLPSVLTARETLKTGWAPTGSRRAGSGGGNHPAVRAAAAGPGHRGRACRAHPGLHAGLDRRRSPAHAGPPRRFGTAGGTADARAVFSWSYHHLSPRACRLFRLLSLQPANPNITIAAAASLLGTPPEEANRLMAELTSTALITEHQPCNGIPFTT